jgi:hypothetical protein
MTARTYRDRVELYAASAAAAAGLVPSGVADPVPEALVPGSQAPVPGNEAAVPAPGVPGGSAHSAARSGAATAPRHLTRWQAAAGVAVIVIALAVFAYGAAGSYESVYHLALRHKMPLPRLVPIGVDGGLVLALLADIVLTWTRQPIWWLRDAARLLVGGSVAANAAAGWPDPIAVFLHCFAPLIVLLVTEAGRTAMLRKNAEDSGRDGIPLARWLASPLSTAALWRRMALWGLKSYAAAVTAEVSRRQAIMQLQQHYGRHWSKQAPGDLVWLLRTGNRLQEACARVAAITTADSAPGTGTKPAGTGNRASGSGTGNPRNRKPRTGNGNPAGNHRKTRVPRGNQPSGTAATAGKGNRPATEPSPTLLADVRRRMDEHRRQHGRDMTAAELAIAIGRRKATALELMRAARAGEPQPDNQAAEAQR